MPHIYGFSVRSSGRDLTQVRRPHRPARYVAPVPVAAPVVAPVVAPVEAPVLKPEDLNKPDLTNLAAAVGVDPSGTKADVLKRVKKQSR